MDRRYTVVCEWVDRQDKDHFDADEIQVRAENAASALRAAREKWSTTIGAEWPGIRLEKVWILTPARLLSLS